MFPLILTVFNGDYSRGTLIPIEDCSCRGNIPNQECAVSFVGFGTAFDGWAEGRVGRGTNAWVSGDLLKYSIRRFLL